MKKSPSDESSTRKALNLMERLHRQEKLLPRQYLDTYTTITSHGSFTYHIGGKAGFMLMGTFAYEENDTRYIIFGDPRNESWHKVIIYADNQVILK